MRILLEPFNSNFPPYGFGVQLKKPYTDMASSAQRDEIEAAFDTYLSPHPAEYARGICQATKSGMKTPVRFLWHFLQAQMRPRVLLKDPLALFSASWLSERYDLQVICTTRSPWAFVASLKVAHWGFSFKNFLAQEGLLDRLPQDMVSRMAELVDKSADPIEKWSHLWNVLHHQIVNYQEQHKDWSFVRYEDIAKDPLAGFDVMLAYLGLEMTPAIKDYIASYTSKKNVNAVPSTHYQPRDSKETIESWRQRLTSKEIDLVGKLTRPLAAQLYPDIQMS